MGAVGSVGQDSDGRIFTGAQSARQWIARKALFQLPAELALTESNVR